MEEDAKFLKHELIRGLPDLKEATLQLCTTRIILSASREIGNGTTSNPRTQHSARNVIPYLGRSRNDNPLIPLPASWSDADLV
jgi:hypothetical protein